MTQIPKMNPEGFEVAAKVWNDRYVELSKNVAADQEKQTKHVQLLADEIQSLLDDKADLIAACDAALDWADANARWFDISTAPKEEGVSFMVTTQVKNSHRSWTETHVVHLNEDGQIHPECHQGWNLESYSHWRPLPPPPSNPPLPEPIERLGEVLRKVKGLE